MNRDRRKALKVILGKMEGLTSKIEEVKEALQEVIDEEEEALGNLPESIQDSERGETMQGYIDAMEEVVEALDELDMDDLHEKIEEIALG